ncbi:MAG: tetrahydromethanopterin S-methyltransferase subunit B [Methanothrix sp.]|jgi:tetrahydromethanopterin S-methyltransferase subunit B|nr:tetrahydromethanopterin S-methyltransferase subunit B [Methanothrix sp.]
MGIVRISSELGLSFDPLKGIVAEERDDVIQYSLDPIYPMVERLDHIADDLVNQLAPDAELMESYANRGKASYNAGLYTNIWMGFIIGLVVAFVILISTLFTSEDGLNIIKTAMGGA